METKTEKGTKAVTIKRTFDLPITTVWQAFTDSEKMKSWWGPAGFTCPSSTIDLKPGGKYLHCMRSPEGQDFWSTGIYKEIIPYQKLVCTDSFSDEKGNIISASELGMPGEWPRELLVTVTFKETNGKTEIDILQESIPVEMFDDCITGWQQSLDKIEKKLK